MLRARGLIGDACGFVSEAIADSGLDRDFAASNGVHAGVTLGP